MSSAMRRLHEPLAHSPWLSPRARRQAVLPTGARWFLAGLTLAALAIGGAVLSFLPDSDPQLLPSLLMTPMR